MKPSWNWWILFGPHNTNLRTNSKDNLLRNPFSVSVLPTLIIMRYTSTPCSLCFVGGWGLSLTKGYLFANLRAFWVFFYLQLPQPPIFHRLCALEALSPSLEETHAKRRCSWVRSWNARMYERPQCACIFVADIRESVTRSLWKHFLKKWQRLIMLFNNAKKVAFQANCLNSLPSCNRGVVFWLTLWAQAERILQDNGLLSKYERPEFANTAAIELLWC